MPSSKRNSTQQTARVLIVDDHPAVRDGLAIRISRESDLEVCGEAADVSDALCTIERSNPDIAIVDISLATGNGIDLIKRVKSRHGSMKILVWSMHDDNIYAERALRAGANGYINKRIATDTIIVAIRRVLEGKVFLSPDISEKLLSRTVGFGIEQAGRSPIELLSDRELESFEMIGRGLGTQEIANQMKLSPKTVETYRARILQKLGLRNATELVHHAVRWVLEKD